MRERRPSQTASFVALARALADRGLTTLPGFSDPVVASLLSPGWAAALAAISRWARRAGRPALGRAIAQLDVIPLRVAALDAHVERAVAGGCRQLVILGAGLDTRAFRMRSLAEVDVFEVDHRATQSYKRRKTAAIPKRAGSLTFVPVDFERDALFERLREAGHRADQPTIWLWEGVVMYLSDQALRATLRGVARASAAGSVLLVHYHEPGDGGRQRHARRAILSLWREPQIGLRTSGAMHDEVRRAGFDVESDTRPADWARELGARAPSGHTASITRLIVARRATARP